MKILFRNLLTLQFLYQIEDMTAEQWIQIRQLEQAFVLTKVIHHLYCATIQYAEAVLSFSEMNADDDVKSS
jgi:hypothetical protein